jgi:nicotinate-nucleotide adenylyltransferase
MRVGILGGTFNPPHIAHLICAQEAHRELNLDQVLLIPTGAPPHKPVEVDPGPEHRLTMTRLAVAADERFAVSDLEVRRAGPSYTVDTLQTLTSQAPTDEFVLILGGDIAAGLPSWREPERVLSLATVAVAERRGTARSTVQDALDEVGAADRARFFSMPGIAVSSTLIRQRVGDGQPIRYLVPDPVGHHIATHGLYRQ